MNDFANSIASSEVLAALKSKLREVPDDAALRP
jgi:hypothetical protein